METIPLTIDYDGINYNFNAGSGSGKHWGSSPSLERFMEVMDILSSGAPEYRVGLTDIAVEKLGKKNIVKMMNVFEKSYYQ